MNTSVKMFTNDPLKVSSFDYLAPGLGRAAMILTKPLCKTDRTRFRWRGRTLIR
jgi:hypothetical protein